MNRFIIGIVGILTFSLISGVLSSFIAGANAFWVFFIGGILGLLGNIFSGILTEEIFNRRQLQSIFSGRAHIIATRAGLGILAILLVLGNQFKFVDFRKVGQLNGFPKDVGFITYVIDNSGSMGCKYKEGFKLDNGYCSDAGNYQVRLAKEWVRKDFKSLNAVDRLRIIEIGGLTSEEGKDKDKSRCKVESLIDTKDINQDSLDAVLNSIKANSSGATNLSGAIIKAAGESIASGIKNQQVIVITDLDQNCDEPDVAGVADIVKELNELGWEQESIKSAVDEIIVFSLSPSPSADSSNAMNLSNQLAVIEPIEILKSPPLTKIQLEIRALRQQGIRVVELDEFKRLKHLSIPSNFNVNFLRIFLTAVATFLTIQITMSTKKAFSTGGLSLALNIYGLRRNVRERNEYQDENIRERPGKSRTISTKQEPDIQAQPIKHRVQEKAKQKEPEPTIEKAEEEKALAETEIVLSWEYPRVNCLSLVITWTSKNTQSIFTLDSIEINDESSEKFKLFRVGKRSEVGGPTSIFLNNSLEGTYLISVEDLYRRERKNLPGIEESHGTVEIIGRTSRRSFNCPTSGNDQDRWNVCTVNFTDTSMTIEEINELDNYK